MIAVSVSGEDTVARGLGTLTARLGDLTPAFVNLDAEVEAEAVPLIPVLSGRLVESFTGEATAEGYSWSSELEYAGVQAYGWPEHGIEAHGFVDAAERVLDALAGERIEDLLTSTARRAGLI